MDNVSSEVMRFNAMIDQLENTMKTEQEKLKDSLQLLLKLLSNIGNNPMEMKFRRIKKSNPAIKEKLFRLNCAHELLILLGFEAKIEEGETIYVLEDKCLGQMLPLVHELRNRVELIEARQISIQDYERVKAIQELQTNFIHQQEADHQKQHELQLLMEGDRKECKQNEVKDSIAVNLNQKKQQSPLQHISGDAEFNTKVLHNDKPVLVDFYADWCMPCKKLSELIESESQQSKGWVVAKVDCDDSNNAAIKQRLGVSGIPAIFLYHKGQQLTQFNFTGFNPSALKLAINKAIQLNQI